MTVQELNSIFGKNIKKYRTLKGWSQEYLAEKMGISTNTICEIETGKKFVRAETLITFAAVFHTEVYELFKPDSVLPGNTSGVLQKYSEDLIKAVEKLRNTYLGKIKQ
jgi:transcriptional regulator with XRE-family HTH domain